jgi:hypothetical protein
LAACSDGRVVLRILPAWGRSAWCDGRRAGPARDAGQFGGPAGFFLQGRDHWFTTRVSRDGWLLQARLLEAGRFGAG